MRVITLGPKGTFSHLAALEEFPGATILFEDDIDTVIKAFRQDDSISYAILPLYNNLSKEVKETQIESLKIVKEKKLPISHELVGFGTLAMAKVLYAQPHSYKQCQKNLNGDLRIEYTTSNAISAKIIAERKNPFEIALVPPLAAKLYSLPILKRNVQDQKDNVTTFAIISR